MNYTVLESIRNQSQDKLRDQFAVDVLMGLSDTEKKLSSRYLYDDEGSKLFSAITELKEYYPTACEFEVLNQHAEKIASLLEGIKFNLVELGAGDARKTKVLLKCFQKHQLQFQYVPIDISEGAMKDLTRSLDKEFPKLESSGVVGDYISSLQWISENLEGLNVVLFLGSNIGNFNRANQIGFLRRVWKTLNHQDYFFSGFDLKKDVDVLLHAYNDSQGVTRKFNLNLLKRINSELGGNFELSQFQHFGTYSPQRGAMESYLLSLKDQKVKINDLEREFRFRAYEPIHIEYSYKFLPSEVDSLAEETGFQVVENLFDSKRFFMDALWRVRKNI